MPRRAISLADRLRAHREAMQLALQLGCTPAEARQELDRRAAWDRHRELMARAAAMGARPATAPEPDEPRPLPWWQRD